jgi:hypothetical protein
MSVRSVVSAACLALVLAVVCAANALGGTSSLNAAKGFHKYPVYWAGTEVAGLKFEGVNHGRGGGFTFLYGNCELSGFDHPSCAPPIEIQQVSTCDRWASELNKVGDLVNFRGAKAKPGLAPLEIFTGRSTIVLFVEPTGPVHSADPEKFGRTIARALRTVHQSHPMPMAPPAKGSLTGQLPCQKQTAKQFE